jgi:hypothetical protein
MTYPLWSGIDAEAINSTDINGCAPSPPIITQGFSSAVIPVLIGTYGALWFEVLYARHEQRNLKPISETRSSWARAENKKLVALPEKQLVESERSHKKYPRIWRVK